jgi:hypothetical protein
MENSGKHEFGRGLKCGSGGSTLRLARECGVSFNINFDCYTAIASKLAPTGFGFDRQTVFRQALQNGGYLKAKRRPLAAV